MTSLAEAIKALRERTGSHEKLATKLGATRNSVIMWEKGRFPKKFIDELVDAGIPAELLAKPTARQRRKDLESEVAGLTQGLEEARETVGSLLGRVEALEQLAGVAQPAPAGSSTPQAQRPR